MNKLNTEMKKKNKELEFEGIKKGAVMTLNPSKPLTCLPNITVYEAAQKMIGLKENCMLVVDENEELIGIFTAKDLAFRVVGSKLSFKETLVENIMTTNPMCAKLFTKASDALNLMVIKHFRHLPIVNDDNQIVGVLDITKCYREAMKKLENLYKDSKQLYDAMETVNKELGNSVLGRQQHTHIISYFENLKKLLSGPTLEQLLNDESTFPVYCSIHSKVYDAAVLMKLKKKTAILVRGFNDEIVGIFTSKDIVSRVISKGINPFECKVEDVMTGNPASALSSMSINEALKQMFDGKYLNLPVVSDKTNEIVGIVDIIRLTNFTLNQIQTMETLNEEDEDIDDDFILNEELASGGGTGNEGNASDFNKFLNSIQDVGADGDEYNYDSSIGDVSVDEIAQFDLSSMAMSESSNRQHTNKAPKHMHSLLSIGTVDYNEVCFFKFKVSRGRIHRVSYRPSDGIAKFKDLLKEEFTAEEVNSFDEGDFEISYIDEDNDIIVINTDKDLKDCVLLMKSLQRDKIEILLYDKHEVLLGKKGKMSTLNLRSSYERNSTRAGSGMYLLPTAIFTLAATIAVVFTLSRRR